MNDESVGYFSASTESGSEWKPSEEEEEEAAGRRKKEPRKSRKRRESVWNPSEEEEEAAEPRKNEPRTSRKRRVDREHKEACEEADREGKPPPERPRHPYTGRKCAFCHEDIESFGHDFFNGYRFCQKRSPGVSHQEWKKEMEARLLLKPGGKLAAKKAGIVEREKKKRQKKEDKLEKVNQKRKDKLAKVNQKKKEEIEEEERMKAKKAADDEAENAAFKAWEAA